MKTLTAQITFMAVLLALPVFVSAQVFEGGILRTQAEVDAFNYTEVTGSLTIGNPEEGAPSSDIKNLESLSALTKVGNLLLIVNNDQLKDLQGLNNLSSVHFLYIVGNDQLQNLQGLGNLTKDLNLFWIINNASLASLQGLNNLDTGGYLDIVNNASLTSLQGLENLSSLNGLSIEDNDQLQNLQGLGNLSVENLLIRNNDQLQNLQGPENLSGIYYLYITNNNQLQNLQGLNNLDTSGELEIVDNASLSSLQGLENLTTVEFSFRIANNASLTSLQGLENLQTIEDLAIENNPILNDCCAIANLLSKVSGEKTIRNNDSNCNSVEVIQDNCVLVITGFTLVNATTDQDLFDLELGNTPAVINILETGNQLNIRANTGGAVGSVVFALDGVTVNTENELPYALFGDEPPGDYHAGMLALGRHTLTATPYDEKNGKGQAGEPLTLEFVVIDQPLAVISFTLVTTDDDQDQYELKEDAFISFKQYDPAKLNIRANTFGEVGSVVFELDGKIFRTENVSPYALAGDNPPNDYHDWTPPLGEHILKATPYTEKNGGGEAGPSLTIKFTVVEEQIPNVHSFTLVNATTDQDIAALKDGDILDLAALGNPSLTIRANTIPVNVDSVSFEFTGPPSSEAINWNSYQLVGDAFSTDSRYAVTPEDNDTKGAAWNKHPIDLNHNFDFTFTINLCGGADGMVFALQQAGLFALGGQLDHHEGSELGYYYEPNDVFDPSIGIEIDIYNYNGIEPFLYYDPPELGTHITLVKHGNPAPITELVEISPEINNCADRLFRIVWNSAEKTLAVYFDNKLVLSHEEDLVKTVFSGKSTVYFGFTGATGGSTALQTFRNTKLIYHGPITTMYVEHHWPYALFGDDIQGDYYGKPLKPGKYTLTATPYSEQQGQGDQGKSLTITFEVQDDMTVAKAARKSSEEDKEKEVFIHAVDVEQGATDLLVYPNPSTGIVKIEYRGTANESVHIAVYDLTGRMIYTTERKTPFNDQIDLQKFGKGLKIVKVQSGNTVAIERIILE